MSDLTETFQEYFKTANHPNLLTFVTKNESIVKKWIAYHDTVEEATRALKNKMKHVYNQTYPKRTTGPTLKVDLTELFATAKTDRAIYVEGERTLVMATQAARRRVETQLMTNSDNGDDDDNGNDDGDASVSATIDAPTEDDVNDIILDNGFNLTHGFERFKSSALQNSKTTGFTMYQDVHEVLSLNHILLLNDNQHGKSLVDFLGLDNLNRYHAHLKKSYMDDDVAVDDTLMQKLVVIFRKLKNKSRKTIKHTLMKTCMDTELDDLDESMIDILLNCLQKLPDFNNEQAIGEQQLLTNHIDPIVIPLFHLPEHGRVFHWMNRTIEDTKDLRPDGIMYIVEQRNIQNAIGYCEVKAHDSEDNVDSIHSDLFRLASFCKNSLDLGHVKAMMAVQVVGDTIIFYLFTIESAGLYTMFELGRLDAPLHCGQLAQFVMELDFLKQMSATYRANCIRRTGESLTGIKRPSLDNGTLQAMMNPGSPTKKKAKVALNFH
ncbi:hypothetical protein DFQ28_000347 [Apophysomyces sp. BC1034]|nr:hypothetical protein DFQ30_000684 [Apophysomyces sp. BC1015]KAG0183984.1 hypothetical protein DFQ28_000347 [Apophysomyces sp. BC1034]